MQQITVYKIATYILLPFAAFFGFTGIIMLFVGLANPLVLLPAAVLVCFCIYMVACMIFLIKGIGKQQLCNPMLKDWIKINGYISAALGGLSFFNSISMLYLSKAELKKLAAEMLAAQTIKSPAITVEMIAGMLTGFSYVMLFFAIVLLVQLTINSRLLKKYAYLFGSTL